MLIQGNRVFMLNVYARCSSKYISEVMIKGMCATLHMSD